MSITWHGLTEFRAELHTLPADVTAEATPIIQTAASDAADAMRVRYPRRTGLLANSLVLRERPRGPLHPSIRLTNTAPYAHYFEYGTHYTPPGRVFIPIRNQHQRTMYAALAQLLTRYSFTVRGDADG